MLTLDEIKQVANAINDEVGDSTVLSNNSFPDTLLTMYWQFGWQPVAYVSMFQKSISNEGYPVIRYKSGAFDKHANEIGNYDYAAEESTENSNLFPFPGRLTQDMVIDLLQSSRNTPSFNTNINVFLSDNNPQIAVGTDYQGVPSLVVEYTPYKNEPGGKYEFGELVDFNGKANDHGNFYEVDNRILNQYDYEQYINNK